MVRPRVSWVIFLLFLLGFQGCGDEQRDLQDILFDYAQYDETTRAETLACLAVTDAVSSEDEGLLDSLPQCRLDTLGAYANSDIHVFKAGPADLHQIFQAFRILYFARGRNQADRRTFNGWPNNLKHPSDTEASDFVDSRYQTIKEQAPIIFVIPEKDCEQWGGGAGAMYLHHRNPHLLKLLEEQHPDAPPLEKGGIVVCDRYTSPFFVASILVHEVQHHKNSHAFALRDPLGKDEVKDPRDILWMNPFYSQKTKRFRGIFDMFWINPENAGGYPAQMAISSWMIKRIRPRMLINDVLYARTFGYLFFQAGDGVLCKMNYPSGLLNRTVTPFVFPKQGQDFTYFQKGWNVTRDTVKKRAAELETSEVYTLSDFKAIWGIDLPAIQNVQLNTPDPTFSDFGSAYPGPDLRIKDEPFKHFLKPQVRQRKERLWEARFNYITRATRSSKIQAAEGALRTFCTHHNSTLPSFPEQIPCKLTYKQFLQTAHPNLLEENQLDAFEPVCVAYHHLEYEFKRTQTCTYPGMDRSSHRSALFRLRAAMSTLTLWFHNEIPCAPTTLTEEVELVKQPGIAPQKFGSIPEIFLTYY